MRFLASSGRQSRSRQEREWESGVPVHPPGQKHQDGQQEPGTGVPLQRSCAERLFRARGISVWRKHFPGTLMGLVRGGKEETRRPERKGAFVWVWWQE
ncbi:hypothetical protein GAT17_23155 [Phocaeicola vulgatus]|nr:hypothetical protein GAT17_23155 [Phocaeicola vulgatus]